MENKITIEFIESTDGGYIGRIKELDGIFSQGESIEEIRENVMKALNSIIEYKTNQFEVELIDITGKSNSKPKYKIGEFKIVANWGGQTEPLEILDVQWIYHHRMGEYCWGYKMNGYTGLTMLYIPQGYLRD